MENDYKDIGQIALQRIKESGMKPISKSVFSFKRVLFWALVGFSIIIGAISFSVILFILKNNDWDLFNEFGFGFVFKTLPYFWFICIIILTIVGESYYRKTSLGYRHRTIMIILIYIIITVILGSLLHFAGLGSSIEELSNNVPIYKIFTFDEDKFWSNSEGGLISGEIVLVNDNGKTISIIDLNRNLWTVNIENAVIMSKVQIKEGEFINIIGDANPGNIFIAEQIHKSNKANINILNLNNNIVR